MCGGLGDLEATPALSEGRQMANRPTLGQSLAFAQNDGFHQSAVLRPPEGLLRPEVAFGSTTGSEVWQKKTPLQDLLPEAVDTPSSLATPLTHRTTLCGREPCLQGAWGNRHQKLLPGARLGDGH